MKEITLQSEDGQSVTFKFKRCTRATYLAYVNAIGLKSPLQMAEAAEAMVFESLADMAQKEDLEKVLDQDTDKIYDFSSLCMDEYKSAEKKWSIQKKAS